MSEDKKTETEKKSGEKTEKKSGYEVIAECLLEGKRHYPGEFVNPGPDQAKKLLQANCIRMAGK